MTNPQEKRKTGRVLHERFLNISENKSVDSVDVKDYMKAIWGTGVTKIIKSLYDSTEIHSKLNVFLSSNPKALLEDL